MIVDSFEAGRDSAQRRPELCKAGDGSVPHLEKVKCIVAIRTVRILQSQEDY